MIETQMESHAPTVGEQKELLAHVPYEFKKTVAFSLDRVIEKIPRLKENNFRISGDTLDRLRLLIGDEYVDPLEHAIVENRWRSLRFLTTRLISQTGMTAVIAANIHDPAFIVSLLGSSGSEIMENEDRTQAMAEVSKAASPVFLKFFTDYLPDIYLWEDARKKDFVTNVVNAVAVGESLGRPEFTVASYTLLNLVSLMATQQYLVAGGLAGAGVLSQQNIRRSMMEANDLHMSLSSSTEETTRIMQTDKAYNLGHELEKTLRLLVGEKSDWSKGNFRRVAYKLFSRFGFPAIAYLNNGLGLALIQLGQLSSHADQADDNKNDFAQAMMGIRTLDDALNDVARNNLSLSADSKLDAHLKEFHDGEAKQIAESKDREDIAVIAPFEVKYPQQKDPYLILGKHPPLHFKPGIYLTGGSSSGDESVFFKVITHLMNSKEKGESIIKVGKGSTACWKNVHDLSTGEIRERFVYVSSLDERSKIDPYALFAKDCIPTSVTANSVIQELLDRYHNGSDLRGYEHDAIAYALQYLGGLKDKEEIRSGIRRLNLPKEEISVMLQFMPYIQLPLAKEGLISRLKRYTIDSAGSNHDLGLSVGKDEIPHGCIFTKNDFDEIRNSSPGMPIGRALRAKIRLAKIFDRLADKEVKVLAVDTAVDPLSNEDTAVMLEYINKFSERKNCAVLIATDEEYNHNLVVDTDASQHRFGYQGSVIWPRSPADSSRHVVLRKVKPKIIESAPAVTYAYRPS